MAKASAGKTPWFDEASEAPLLAEYARKLDSFLDVVADGRVDAELFPNFARLAGSSTWFHDNTSNSNQTWDALPPDQQP